MMLNTFCHAHLLWLVPSFLVDCYLFLAKVIIGWLVFFLCLVVRPAFGCPFSSWRSVRVSDSDSLSLLLDDSSEAMNVPSNNTEFMVFRRGSTAIFNDYTILKAPLLFVAEWRSVMERYAAQMACKSGCESLQCRGMFCSAKMVWADKCVFCSKGEEKWFGWNVVG